MFYWRSYFCWKLTQVQIYTLPSDLEGYLNRKTIYEQVCDESPGFLPIIISSIGIYYGFRGLALSGVKNQKK